MAASRGSQSMRDQWRVEDDQRDRSRARVRVSRERRRRSSTPAGRAPGSERELKARGRKIDDTDPSIPSERLSRHKGSDRRNFDIGSSNKAAHRSRIDLHSPKRTQELREGRTAHHVEDSQGSPPSGKRRRARSPSTSHSHRIRTRRDQSLSPLRSDIDVERGIRRSRKRRGSASPTSKSYTRFRDKQDQQLPARRSPDTYFPSSDRRRSRSPRARYRAPTSNRRRSTSPDPRSISKRIKDHRRLSPRRNRIDRRQSPTSDLADDKGLQVRIPSRYPSDSTHRSPRSSRRSPSPQSSRPFARDTSPRSRRRSREFHSRSHKSRALSPAFPESLAKSESNQRKARIVDPSPLSSQVSPTSESRMVTHDGNPPPSPPRPIPSFTDSDDHNSMEGDIHTRESFSMHGMHHSSRPSRPHVDTRQSFSTSPQYMTPTSSHHGSPQSQSPYSNGRGGWGGQQQHFQGHHGQSMHGYSPNQQQFRQNNYPPPSGPQGQYYQSHNQHHSQYGAPHHGMQPNYHSPPYRGNQQNYRGSQFSPVQDRRFSGPGPQSFPVHAQRGRGGHYNNLQWTANGGRGGGRGQFDQSQGSVQQAAPPLQPQAPQITQQQSFEQNGKGGDDEDNPFRPSKDLQVEDQDAREETSHQPGTSGEAKKMPPPNRQPPTGPQAKEASKFSFAFKSKPANTSAPAPKVDLAKKTMPEAPSRREPMVLGEGSKARTAQRSTSREPVSRSRPDARLDRRSERYDHRDDNRSDRRSEYRSDRRDDHRSEHRLERPERPERSERRAEHRPEPSREKKILKRMKPRLTLPAEFAASDSVYFRKPGNESVVGSGTYGKVFKAIHVYTKHLVALKKIRMEGERDGFPVTAVREIKLLQSLKHDNVVSLQEVMVEKNDCFMVFEYLSHDLTGLLNHPTFKLDNGHKKHLAKQLFEGLDYLHRRGVLHRDIKAANILVSNEGQLKLADFGLARFFAKRRQLDYTNRVITIWYRSPELLLGETQYGPAVDIWSAACVLIEIFTKHAIFPGDGGEINQLDKIYNIMGTPTRSEWPGLVDMAWFELLRPAERKQNVFAEKYKERLTPAAFELLEAMFQYDPVKRPAASDVLEHPYFTAEEPSPTPASELKYLEGDWHEFESKALRKENERRDKEARRANREELHQKEKEKEKRRASVNVSVERESKRPRPSSPHSDAEHQ
ncbi:MAG: kinase subunit of RNA polymerase II carboxy-terminal domain kinase I [Pycnora praestabilis]|nr:MAG: kinase subunit of RNA polymerase II carboxy-terminal domain kinase I [Pycnora praestabilis]